MAASIQVGDTPDLVLILRDQNQVFVNITSATTLQFKLRRPDGTTASVTATKVTTYTGPDAEITAAVSASAAIHYVCNSSDLALSGTWKLQGFIVLPSGQWRTGVYTFDVLDVL